MGDIDAPGPADAPSSSSSSSLLAVLATVLPSKEFCTSRKGLLLVGEVAASFIAFVCFAASLAVAFVTVPLIEFLGAVFILFAYSTKFNERFKGFLWPLMDFLRCVTASIIYFIVSLIAVFNYRDGSSKAAGIFITFLWNWQSSSRKEENPRKKLHNTKSIRSQRRIQTEITEQMKMRDKHGLPQLCH